MKITTSYSIHDSLESAFTSAYADLRRNTDCNPDLLLIHCTANYDRKTLQGLLSIIPDDVALFGSTSCQGIMTEKGYHSSNNFATGMFAITDKEGDFGTGICRILNDPNAAAAYALHQALDNAGRPGEVPVMVLLAASPGCEEAVIAGIEGVLGPGVPVFGGSSSDNTVLGDWFQFTRDAVYSDAIAISVLFPSTEIVFGFHSGYEPTEHEGTVTRAKGRVLYEIDHLPASHMYNKWSNNLIADYLENGGNILPLTNFFPIGREVGNIGQIPYYNLSHPERAHPDGSLSLFTDIAENDRIIFMKGTQESLIQRPASVARASIETNKIENKEIEGAYVIFCAGSMLGVKDRMNEVVELLNTGLSGMPFLGTFTFGEQGTFVGGENRHGNLMISIVLFTNIRT